MQQRTQRAPARQPKSRRLARPWRLVLALCMLAVLLAGVALAVRWAGRPSTQGLQAVIRVEDAGLYARPDENSAVLAALSPGDVLTIADRREGWYEVTWQNQSAFLKQSAALVTRSGILETDNIAFIAARGIVDTGIQRYGYDEMMADLALFAQRWPDAVSLRTLCVTAAGRDVPLVILGNPDAPHRIWVDASIHGREYMTTQVVMRQLELLLMNLEDGVYQRMPLMDTLEDVCLYVAPMLNPDGVELSQRGIESVPAELRAQVLALNGEKTDFTRWKADLHGVDLNVNFDARWDEASPDVTAPGPVSYKGEAPFSQVETQAVRAMMASTDFDLTISYHCVGGEIYWWFYQTGNAERRDRKIADTFSALTGYSLVSQERSMASCAGLKDWSIETFGTPGLTIELGPAGGPAPIETAWFPAVWHCNRLVLWRAINEVGKR